MRSSGGDPDHCLPVPGEAIVLKDGACIFGVAEPDEKINASWPILLDALRALDDDGWATSVIDDIIAASPARVPESSSGVANLFIYHNRGTMFLALANHATVSRPKASLVQRLRRAKPRGDELLSRL